MSSTKKRGAPVHLSRDIPPTLTSLSSPEHMTGSQLHLNLSPIYPVLLNPYHLIRHSMVWALNMNKNMRVMKTVNQIVTLTLKDLCQQPQGEVPGVQKAYLQCTMDRYKYTAQ